MGLSTAAQIGPNYALGNAATRVIAALEKVLKKFKEGVVALVVQEPLASLVA